MAIAVPNTYPVRWLKKFMPWFMQKKKKKENGGRGKNKNKGQNF